MDHYTRINKNWYGKVFFTAHRIHLAINCQLTAGFINHLRNRGKIWQKQTINLTTSIH